MDGMDGVDAVGVFLTGRLIPGETGGGSGVGHGGDVPGDHNGGGQLAGGAHALCVRLRAWLVCLFYRGFHAARRGCWHGVVGMRSMRRWARSTGGPVSEQPFRKQALPVAYAQLFLCGQNY